MSTRKIRMTVSGTTTEDGGFDWDDALIVAAIVSALGFFSTIGALGVSGALDSPSECIMAGLIVAGTQFFTYLALKRGLTKVED